jgi:predicted ester cyclase
MPNHNEAHDPFPSPSEVMARFGVEVLNNKNLSAIDEIAAEDYVELDLPPGQAPGREGLKEFLANVLFPAFPDHRWVTEEQITEGDKVVSRFTMYGTHRAAFRESQQPEEP